MKYELNRAHGARWLSGILGLGQILVGLAAVGALLWVLISFPVWWSDAPRIPLPVHVGLPSEPGLFDLDTAGGPFRSWDLDRVGGELEVEFANPWAQWLYFFFAVQEFVIVYIILLFLRRILGTVPLGEAFSADNAKRLRWVGALLILEALFGPGASTLIAGAALHGVESTGGSVDVNFFQEFGTGGLFTGWIVLVLSEVFRQGADMKREQQLTI